MLTLAFPLQAIAVFQEAHLLEEWLLQLSLFLQLLEVLHFIDGNMELQADMQKFEQQKSQSIPYFFAFSNFF